MIKTFLFISSIALMLSCETVVDINIPVEPPQLVLNSTMIDGEFYWANLTQSQHILNSKNYEPVEGAIVEVYSENKLIATIPDSLNGNYISANFKPVKGKSYQIKIQKSGYDVITSDVAIPLDTVKIIAVRIDTVEINEFGYTSEYLKFGVDFKDDANTKNYYEISVNRTYYEYVYDYSFSPPLFIDSVFRTDQMFVETRDPSLEEYQSYGYSILFDDEFFDGNTHTVNLLYYENQIWEDGSSPYGPYTYYVVMNNTSKSYYLYELSSALQSWNIDNPFAQPVTVYNNIENGFGVLGAYNTAVYKVE